MEKMALEDYKREQKKCLSHILRYELKKNPKYLEPMLKLKYYLSKKEYNEKDMEIIENYLDVLYNE